MTIERRDLEERQTLLDVMLARRREADQRRLVKQGIALWTRTELALEKAAALTRLRREPLS